MKALLFDGSLHFIEKDPPRPASNEALIRINMAGICNTDIEILKGCMGFQGVPGHEFVGEVIDSKQEEWIGKRVVGEINLACGACNQCARGMERHCLDRKVLGILFENGQQPGGLFQNKVHWIFGCCAGQYTIVEMRRRRFSCIARQTD